MPVDATRQLDALRREGEAAVRAAEGRLDTAVPHLDWTVGDVLVHLAGVHERFARCLRSTADVWPARESVVVPDTGVETWARERLHDVVDAVAAADGSGRYVTWAGPQDRDWVLRRLTNETTVHRWDIEAGVGSPDPIDPELGVDVVEEFLVAIVGSRGLAGIDDAAARDGTTLHLHATDDELGDGTGEWYATVRAGGLEVEHRHDKGDVALRGPAGDLALWLNGRLPASRLDSFGEADLVDWWSQAFRFD